MGTSWSEIISDHAKVFIDDVRLTDQAAESPARFLRRMSLYMKNAIPVFNRPPEMVAYLKEGLTEPAYGDSAWVSTLESIAKETKVETGMTGYELFSCAQRVEQPDGSVVLAPYAEAAYDPETGTVTFPPQMDAGLQYEMDFYTDGAFAHDLTAEQKRLLGLCVASVWDERFFRNWLSDAPKDHDRSFNPPNESQYMEKGNKKKLQNRGLLNEELRKYEQDCAYATAFRRSTRRIELI